MIYCDGPWGKVGSNSIVPVPTTDTELLQIQHAILSLRPGGRGAIVMPQGFAFRKGAAKRVREWLLSNYRLEAVVELQKGTWLPYTGIASMLLFVRRLPPVESVLFLPYSLHNADLGDRIVSSPSESLLTTVLQARLTTARPADIENQLAGWEHDEELSATDSYMLNLAKYLHLVGDEESFPELVPIRNLLGRNSELLWKENRRDSLDALLDELTSAREGHASQGFATWPRSSAVRPTLRAISSSRPLWVAAALATQSASCACPTFPVLPLETPRFQRSVL